LRVESFSKGATGLAAVRILYVSYDPSTLVRSEQLLVRAGYEVDSVLGTDGVMACRSFAEYSCVLIDDACPSEDRKKVISWLRASFPKLNILSASWRLLG
jgi:DNA-binding response OmpR family regulator